MQWSQLSVQCMFKLKNNEKAMQWNRRMRSVLPAPNCSIKSKLLDINFLIIEPFIIQAMSQSHSWSEEQHSKAFLLV